MVPDPSLSIRERAIASWPGAWLGKNLRDILATLGHDIDRPWRELDQADRDWILFTDEQPVVTVHPEREAGPHPAPLPGQVHERPAPRAAHPVGLPQRHHAPADAAVRARPCRARSATAPAAARGAGRHVRRARHRRPRRAAAGRARRGAAPDRASRPAPAPQDGAATWPRPSPPTCSRGSRCCSSSAWATSAMSRSTPTLSGGELQRLRLATAAALGAVRRGLRARRAVGRAAPRRRRAAARPSWTGSRPRATPCSSSSTTWTSYDAPTGSSTSARAPAAPAAGSCTAARWRACAAVPESATRRFLFPADAGARRPARPRADGSRPAGCGCAA